jgi:hypothetical protein
MPADELKLKLTEHAQYYSMQDTLPTAFATKLENREADAFVFAAHPGTTIKRDDRRK